MRYTIHSRRLGRDVEFSRPFGHYIYVDLNGQPGLLGRQICEGGSTMGYTLGYSGDDEAAFQRICRRWWSRYLKGTRDFI